MKKLIRAIVIAAVALPTVGRTQHESRAAEEAAAFARITRLLNVYQVSPIPPDPSDERSLTPIQQEAARLQLAAQAAKEFYTSHRDSPKAAQARKLELIAGLSALRLGAADTEGYHSRALAFQADRSTPAADRLEVALQLELALDEKAGKGKSKKTAAEERESVADRLYAALGGTPEVAALYLGLIADGRNGSSSRIAAKIEGLNLPDSVKREGGALARKIAAEGRPIELALSTVEGEKVVFESLRRLTIVVSYNASRPDSLSRVAGMKAMFPSADWIFLGFGPKPAGRVALPPGIVGKQCYDPSGLEGAAAAALDIVDTEYGAVVSASGKLLGSDTLESLPSLVAKVTK